ncbi:hopene-associated glycosyltransferase HpnB [Roseomonas rosea]|uniref:Hopene-associated glycosyltransferase HpnB n=1 Tax=Muricoccus roseus TaxID=198092 RepID=A0A1M6KKH1_9PROT|nr:glycosyltransferase [Roseomonas rosea]SHJ59436.1 hopene-associated glycosyltransferase HpnB [Roseomonas rosea]
MSVALFLGLLPMLIWLAMLLARGGFWLARDRDDRDTPPEPAQWPAVVAVVPARNEADVIAASIGSLMRQDYPGPFRVVLVDDGSTDRTAETARGAGGTAPLEVLTGAPLPQGWTGKLWALEQGVRHATGSGDAPAYVLLTDADIGHAPGNLRALVARAEAGRHALVTLMAELSCVTRAERFLIPAFVFFFQMLYPFAWVSDARRRIAAGAGGCMLVRREALERAGGIASIRTAIIDDCALARRLKAQGPIWLGLTHRAKSLRPYGEVAEIGRMVSRSAYAQLRYSPLLLAGTVLGMVLTYHVPPALAVFGSGWAQAAGMAAWAMMALAFQPMLRFYRVSPLWGVALPAIGAAYTWFTVQSALQVWRGKGGMWKGRAQAMAGGA